MVVRDANGENPRIKCDECEVTAPDGDAILKGRGLINMGWECSGGSHRCPTHSQVADNEKTANLP